MKNAMHEALVDWASLHNIDLTKATISPGESYVYSQAYGLKLVFHQSDNTRKNFQNVKRALGGRFTNEVDQDVDQPTTAPDSLTALYHFKTHGVLNDSAIQILKDKISYDFKDCMLVQWYGAYECKAQGYDCNPAAFKEEE